MRITAVFASCLLLVGVAQAECVALEPQKSSGHVRIAVVLNGKPLKGVTVSIYQDYPTAPHFSDLTTDENGIVALPRLSRGTYDISATFQGVVTSSLSLGVTTGSELSAFSIDLTEPVQRAEKIPVHHRLQAFRGTVVDPSGAMIPVANVMVVRKGSQLQDVVLKTKLGADGHFSGQLPEGSYIAFFFSRGFETDIVPFDLIKDGTGELRITLTIGHC